MDKLKLHTPDLTATNIEKLAALFPNCVTEARDEKGHLKQAIDFDLLRQELSTNLIEGDRERYRLDWPGKREALVIANSPIAKTLRPSRQESVDFETTKNLFIEGDNLDALKLLQEIYLNKIKVIFIDPPYNTGKDFVYADDFRESSIDYFERSNQRDEDGSRLVSNTESNGRFHSDWLTMMYSRLKLARNLLSDDGAIFIAIDDGEGHNLKKICDEIFGEANFIANAVWRSKDNSNNDAKRFSYDHNHILVYSRNEDWQPATLQDTSKQSHFKNPDNDPKGAYFDGNPLNSPNYRENLIYEIKSPEGIKIPAPKNGWRWSPEVMKSKIESGEIRFNKAGTGINRRTYLCDAQGLPPSTLWTDLEKTGHNRQAKYELLKILPEDLFETPKPIKLLSYIIRLAAVKDGDVILDFFSGSASTAHAAVQFSADDGIDCRYIMVQLAETCAEGSDAAKAGYSTVAEIGKERIRRAGAKIRAELEAHLEGELAASDKHQDVTARLSKLDTGFRVLKIDTSNMKDVYYAPDEVKQDQLELHTDNIKDDRTPEDLLFQVLVDWGVDLTLPIAEETIAKKKVFFVDGDALAACFDPQISEDLVKALAKRKPLRAVFRDSGFGDDSMKINIEQIFKLLSPGTELRSL